MDSQNFNLEAMVDCLKSAAEPSRLRILNLLASGDLTVSDITMILSQSQPRVSRHLKLLMESGLINRWQEGSWALFRTVKTGPRADLLHSVLQRIDPTDPVIAHDRERLEEVKQKRRAAASDYFSRNAQSWDAIRKLQVPEKDVETALLELAGKGPFNAVLDIGTGTGRILELFGPHARSAVGIDSNRDMLNVARSNLEAANLPGVEIRLGDVYSMPVTRNSFDLVIIHQVLHFLDDPAAAIREAARSLSPSGRLIVVDFALHEQEMLRVEHQHQRLGFDKEIVSEWFAANDLDMAATRALKMSGKGAAGALTVMIWVGQDRRIEIADTHASTRQPETVA